MPSYNVQWDIDVDAPNPRAAAEQARQYQQDPFTLATFFDVKEDESGKITHVDLSK